MRSMKMKGCVYMAYMTNKKEPVTVGAVAGSKQEICDNIPADIIHERLEDVKPSHDFSPLVADALWNAINALREEAAELADRETALVRIISDYKDRLRSVDEQLVYVEAEIEILLEDYEAVVGGGRGN